MNNPYAPPPPDRNPYSDQAPGQYPGQPQPPYEGDATGGLIPYKNPHALMAYYGGIITLLCCIAPLPLGLIPLILGVIGLQRRAQNPAISGSAHAWIGIVLGGLSAVCSFGMIVLLILVAINEK